MFKTAIRKAIVTTSVLTMVVGAGSAFAANVSGSLTIDGSSTVFPLTSAIAEEFSIDNPDARVTVSESGTGTGISRFCNGEITIADASRKIKDTELAACSANNITPKEIQVGLDGVTIITNQKNTWAKKMSMAQLKALFEQNSKIKRWSDINKNWPKKVITFYTPSLRKSMELRKFNV
jgi:phosphate transport system substrate-binding protein